MARAKTKEELLRDAGNGYRLLLDYIDSLTPAQQTQEFPEGTLNRNIRDVLAHLHHWHLLFFTWHEQGMRGEKPAMPAPGYSWKETPALNRMIREEYRNNPLKDVRDQLDASHAQVMRIIEKYDNDELFTKKRFRWTGSTSLGAYLVSTSSSHYQWALKLIKKCVQKAE